MNSIKDNLNEVLNDLPEGVVLAAVSKYHPDETIMEAYNAGCRIFAENRPQEFSGKFERLPKDIQWHFIGHIQRNKVKDVVGKTTLIHSIDSIRLIEAINSESASKNITTDILLEVFIAKEETKHGFSPNEIREIMENGTLKNYKNINIKGLMTMASYTDDAAQIESEFSEVKALFDEIKEKHLPDISILSMGMSGDYKIAVKCGANLVRVGSKIFGARQY